MFFEGDAGTHRASNSESLREASALRGIYRNDSSVMSPHGRGCGVGRCLGGGICRGVGVGRIVAVGVAVGVIVGVDVGVAVAVGVTVGVTVGVGLTGGVGVGVTPPPPGA